MVRYVYFVKLSDIEQNTSNFSSTVQILMSVTIRITTPVMRMHSALTQWGVSHVCVNLAILEMEGTVQVSNNLSEIKKLLALASVRV